MKSDGTVWAWGDNAFGNLGNGTTTNSSVPVQVEGLANVKFIAGGRDHSLAIETNGTVWAWGWNEYGQVGDGTKTNRARARPRAGGSPARVQVAAGAEPQPRAALERDRVGVGPEQLRSARRRHGVGRLVPVKVPGIANAINVGAGRLHSLAIEKDRSVWAWGDNDFGQLGDGTTAERLKPVRVPGSPAARRSRVAATTASRWCSRSSGDGSRGSGAVLNVTRRPGPARG